MLDQTNMGGLSFEITPNDAELFVDNVRVGTVGEFTSTTQPLSVAAGHHHVEIRADGSRRSVSMWISSPARCSPTRVHWSDNNGRPDVTCKLRASANARHIGPALLPSPSESGFDERASPVHRSQQGGDRGLEVFGSAKHRHGLFRLH